MKPFALWFSRGFSDGWRLWGTAGDEFGRKTFWLRVPFGAVIWAYRWFRFDEILDDEAGNFLMAEKVMDEFAFNRRIFGHEPPLPGEPEFSNMTFEEILDWEYGPEEES